jgi:hypothetical protein
MHTAVKGMYEERTWIWNAFVLGAVAFSLDMLILKWVLLTQNGDGGELAVAGLCTLIFIGFATVCVAASKRIVQRFSDENTKVHGSSKDMQQQMSAEEFLRTQNAAQMLDNAPSKRGEGTGVGGIGGEGSMLEGVKKKMATTKRAATASV